MSEKMENIPLFIDHFFLQDHSRNQAGKARSREKR